MRGATAALAVGCSILSMSGLLKEWLLRVYCRSSLLLGLLACAVRVMRVCRARRKELFSLTGKRREQDAA